MWEYSVCDNCGSKKNKVFLNNITTWEYSEKFRIVECETCSLKYINPRPKKNSIHKFYSEKGYWGRDLQQVKTSFKKFKSVREKSYKNIYRNILRFKSKGNIFDVGAGLGLFLSKFKDLDWKVDGVELNPKAVKFAKRNFSINLGNADFDGIKLSNKKYNVVTFNNSLEHLYNPNQALKKAYSMLKKGGLLIITVPNIESLGEKIFKEKWLPLHPPKHLYHFSEGILKKMLNESGFVVDKVSHWYFEHGYYGIFNSIRYSLSPKFRQKRDEAPRSNDQGIFTPLLRREQNPSEAEISSHSSPSLRSGFSAKGDKGKTVNIKANNKDILSITKKGMEKVAASILSAALTVVGSAIGKGETITIYAKKD